MHTIIEVIAEFFFALLSFKADEVYSDREVPVFAKALLLVLTAGLIAGVLLFCWKFS